MEDINKVVEVLQAFQNKKQLQCLIPNNTGTASYWKDFQGTQAYLLNNIFKYEFRIKPSLKYVPYGNAEEFLQAQKEHGPYIIIKGDNKLYAFPVKINDSTIVFEGGRYNYDDLLGCKWQDGTKWGKLAEE